MMESLSVLDIGQINKAAIVAWLKTITDIGDEKAPYLINEACQTFSIYNVQKSTRIRMQFAMSQGPLRSSVLSALGNLSDIHVATGAAPKGFLEEELTEWMAALQL